MLAKLKKSCPDCTESSQKTYLKSIRALSKLAGNDEVPATHRWINKPLLAKIKKRPLVQYKRFAIAGVKALKAYGVTDNKPWWEAMRDATAKYTKVRLTGKRTKREAERWPKGGYKAIAKLAKTLHSEVAHLEGAKSLSLRDLWLYQRYFVLLFYSRHTLRGDLADVRIKRGTKPQSWVYKKKRGGYHMHIGQHKTVKSRGALEIDLDPAVDKALDKFLPMVRKHTDHGFLLTTRTGTRMEARRHDAADREHYRDLPRQADRHPNAAGDEDHRQPQVAREGARTPGRAGAQRVHAAAVHQQGLRARTCAACAGPSTTGCRSSPRACC